MYSTERLLRTLENVTVQPFSGFVYRVISEKYRESPLSAVGSVRSGGRYNQPNTFPVLYCAESQMTALLEIEALFSTADGQLKGAPRDPDLILSLRCDLARVLDLTDEVLLKELGTNRDELVSFTPSRFILNARGEATPTQTLGAACSFSGRVSAIKVPSAVNRDGYCLDLFPDSFQVGESVAILDDSNRIKATINGFIPAPTIGRRRSP